MWHRFRALSRRERRLLVQAFIRLPIAAARVRFGGVVTPNTPSPAAATGGDAPPVIREAARMVAAAARYAPITVTCLPQSIVLQDLLRREGIDTVLRIGVRKSDGVLDGHAWVEYQGVPVQDPPGVHERFTVLDADSRS